MTLRLPPTSRALKTLLAALIGIGSGLVAVRIGMPLPWMLGPMLGCGAAALAGAPVFGPTSLRPVVMPVIGVMLGASFHPGLFAHAGEWIGTLLLLAAFLVVATAATFAFYRLVGGYSAVDAFFCAAPGGLNEMVLLGGAAGGDERRIALAMNQDVAYVSTMHVARIVLVIFGMSVVFRRIGHRLTAAAPPRR